MTCALRSVRLGERGGAAETRDRPDLGGDICTVRRHSPSVLLSSVVTAPLRSLPGLQLRRGWREKSAAGEGEVGREERVRPGRDVDWMRKHYFTTTTKELK